MISGPGDLVDALAPRLTESGIQASTLVTSHAYHSPMMAPVRLPLVTAVAAVRRGPATLPIISTARARVAGAHELCEPDYWGAQLLAPVRFADSIAVAAPDAHRIVLEVGPGQTLTTLARQALSRENARGTIPCQGPVQSAGSSVANLLAAVGRLWLSGITPDWSGVQAGFRQRVALPTYPFERRRFWVEPMKLDTSQARGDADALDMQPASTETATPRLPDVAQGGLAAGVEQLIERQLALISEQIQMLAEAPGSGVPAGNLSAGPKPIR